jgi:hypothetical protein
MCNRLPTHYACFTCRISLKRNTTCPVCGGDMKDMGYKFKAPRKLAVAKWRALEESGKRFGGCGCEFGGRTKRGFWHTQQADIAQKAATGRYKAFYKAFTALVSIRPFRDDKIKSFYALKLSPERAAELWALTSSLTDATLYIEAVDDFLGVPHVAKDQNYDTRLYRRSQQYGAYSSRFITW